MLHFKNLNSHPEYLGLYHLGLIQAEINTTKFQFCQFSQKYRKE